MMTGQWQSNKHDDDEHILCNGKGDKGIIIRIAFTKSSAREQNPIKASASQDSDHMHIRRSRWLAPELGACRNARQADTRDSIDIVEQIEKNVP